MKKIEIIKETSRIGTITYHIEEDGEYVYGTTSTDLPKAEEYFELIKLQSGTIKQTIKSINL